MRREAVLVAVLALVVAPLLFAAIMLVAVGDILGVGAPPPEPPEAALVYEGRRVEPGWSTIGCWRERRTYLPDNRACESSEAGLPSPSDQSPDGTLRVRRGEGLSFRTDWPHEPEEVTARAVRTDRPFDAELAADQALRRRGTAPGVHDSPAGYPVLEVAVRRDGEGAEVVMDVPPGEYLLVVRLGVDDAGAVGEAYYDFDVEVEEG